MDESILPFLKPRGVVVVGVSASPEKLGHGIARNLSGSGYTGGIHFVGQRREQLFGRPLYTDMQQVPDPVDLAVLAVPGAAMPDALRACAQRGIHAAILVSAGFRESGREGAELEEDCVNYARANAIRLLGPNCIGIIDTHLPLDTSFLQPPMPPQGGIAFVSHSGAFSAAMIDWARAEGFGFSQIVSLGNQADVSETDMLAAVAEDVHTRVIVMYLEGVADGPRFVELAGDVTRRTPVVALKVGRSEPARRAAASHTGALAGSDDAFDAAFSRAGVFRAASAEELFDWARALEVCSLPFGRNVAILTDAGGPGVIAADALDANGLTLAALSATTQEALSARLPPAASVQNPVDMLASASPDDYGQCLRLLLAEDAIDAVLVILPPPPMYAAEAVANALVAATRASKKPVVVALMGSTLVERAQTVLREARIPTYPFPERAASALGILARRAEGVQSPASSNPVPAYASRRVLRADPASSPPEEVISACGIATAPMQLATSAEEAARIAQQLGWPVVLKISSPGILHKSDVEGVLVNIGSVDEVLSGYAQIIGNAQRALPDALLNGVQVQKQIPFGQDVIVGAVRDPTFGPLMMFGSGGVEAEGLRDVAFALAPLTAADAYELMRRTWAGRRLEGFRSVPPADKIAVQDALVRLAWLMCQNDAIKEIEINPLRALADGAVALDVRLII